MPESGQLSKHSKRIQRSKHSKRRQRSKHPKRRQRSKHPKRRQRSRSIGYRSNFSLRKRTLGAGSERNIGLKIGDLVIMRYGWPHHVGIVVEIENFDHVLVAHCTGTGCMVHRYRRNGNRHPAEWDVVRYTGGNKEDLAQKATDIAWRWTRRKDQAREHL